MLNAAAVESGLRPSSVLRKARYAALTQDLIEPVQIEEETVSAASIVVGVVLLIVFLLITAVIRARSASEQQKERS